MKTIFKNSIKEMQEDLNFFTFTGFVRDFILSLFFLAVSLWLSEYVFKSKSFLHFFSLMIIGMFGMELILTATCIVQNIYYDRKDENNMAKLTTEQRIKKVTEYISKEELLIEASKEKIKSWCKELKLLQEEKDKEYAADFLKLLSENGLTTDDQKTEFMLKIEEQLKNENEKSESLGSNISEPNI